MNNLNLHHSNFKRWLFVFGWVSLFSLLNACSSSKVVREPMPLAPLTSPLDVALEWQLKTGNLLAADAQGLVLALDGTQLYYAMSDGTVTAVRTTPNGPWQSQVLWQTRFSTPVLSGIVRLKDGLLIGTAKGKIVKLDAKTGQILWQKQLSSEVLTVPLVDGERFYSRTVDGKLYALSTETGEQIWVVEHPLPNLSLRGLPSATLVNNTLYVGWETGQLQALSAQSGETLWQTQVVVPKGRTDLERLVDLQAAPVLYQGRLYVLAYQGKLVALDPQTGDLYWSKKLSGYQKPLIHQNWLLVQDDMDQLHAFDLATGTKLWQSGRFKYRRLTQLKVDDVGRLLVGDGLGYLHWLDPLNGTEIARTQVSVDGSNGESVIQVYPTGERVYVLDDAGYLTQYRIVPSELDSSQSP